MPKQQERVEQLFGAALERRPEDRRAFLDQTCASQPGLRRRVEELLLEHDRLGSFLENSLLPHDSVHPDITSETLPSAGSQAAYRQMGPATARFQPGQSIANRFTIVRFIAHGGMGEVYEVADRFLQNVHVALKVVLPEIAVGAGSSHRFEQEVLLARKVTHPNLCPIYDISLCQEPAPPFLFLTMKLLGGETLAARMRRPAPFSREETLAIFRQVTAGVAAMHAAGIIHRDIKPNNIMMEGVGSDLCLSIMDFGLARLHESEATVLLPGLVAGTPGYIAPELFRGHPPSQASDLFALGVVLHQVLTGVSPGSKADGMRAEPSSTLAVADVPSTLIHCVEALLSEQAEARCAGFEWMQGYFGVGFATGRYQVGAAPLLTRRRFLVGSAVGACALAGGAFLGRDHIEDWLQPLPSKRFVALLNWPSAEETLKPMLVGVIDAIASELSRAEAFDRDLFVIAGTSGGDIRSVTQLNEIRDSLGANLVLAAYCVPRGKDIELSLRVLGASSSSPLRETRIRVPREEQTSLPQKAVHAAARLLDVSKYSLDDQRSRPGTSSLEAFAAFQAAEAVFKQPNDTGLDAAIVKYKQAVDLDPRYAQGYARLAMAYSRFYSLHRDAGALSLAKANAETALRLDPNLVDARVALAFNYKDRGEFSEALIEIAKALSIDPLNADTLLHQAQIYTRAERWSEAEATLNRVLSMRPNYWLAHNELGFTYYSQGKYAEAVSEFRLATLAAPGNALAYSNLGSIYLEQGKLEPALENNRKSFALIPNEAAAAAIAAIYRAKGDYTNAIAFADKATRLAPSDPSDWLELGDCLAASPGRNREAAAAYTRAVQVLQERLRTEEKSGRAWMLLALCLKKVNREGEAITALVKAEALHADDIDSQLSKARLLELLGRRAEAMSTIVRCLQRGATEYQVARIPDLEKLRADPHYRQILGTVNSATAMSS